jgi:sugar phosphate isomerase/epimerase
MLSFSTCWNSHRHAHGRDVVEEILALGVDAIELGHGLKAPMVQEILDTRRTRKFRVSSLHNFCPLPPEVQTDAPDCYEFTSHRPEDRERAVRLTRQTIDMAARFDAEAVVIHCGRIRTLDISRPLRTMIEDGKFLSKSYCLAKVDAVIRREQVGEIYIQRVLECLVELSDYAAKKGILLGLENREHYEAVPTEREFGNFLQRLDSAHAGYWHDFGHAQIKENMALLDHVEWLTRIATRTVGCHVHDVQWPLKDHCPPLTGGVPFDRLVPLLPAGCRMVFELHPRTSQAEVTAALRAWRERYDP